MRRFWTLLVALMLLSGVQGFCQQPKPASTSSTGQTATPSEHKGRKGFIIGLGLGPGQTGFSSWTDESHTGRQSSKFPRFKFSVNSDFKIGVAPSRRVLICWASEVAWYLDNTYPAGSDPLGSYTDDVVWANGIGVACVSYFFRPYAPSVYIFGGPGLAWLSAPFDGYSASAGFGFTVGGGVEFARHWCVEGSMAFGAPRVAGATIRTVSLKIAINWLGY
jgi:hypothetical protein